MGPTSPMAVWACVPRRKATKPGFDPFAESQINPVIEALQEWMAAPDIDWPPKNTHRPWSCFHTTTLKPGLPWQKPKPSSISSTRVPAKDNGNGGPALWRSGARSREAHSGPSLLALPLRWHRQGEMEEWRERVGWSQWGGLWLPNWRTSDGAEVGDLPALSWSLLHADISQRDVQGRRRRKPLREILGGRS